MAALLVLLPRRCVLKPLADSFTTSATKREGESRHADIAIYPFLEESGYQLLMMVPHLAQHIGLVSGNAGTKLTDFHDTSLFQKGGLLGD